MANLKIFVVVVATIAFYTLLANAIPQVQSQVPEETAFGASVTAEELVAAGQQLYEGAGGCTACHGLGTRAPNLLTDQDGLGLIGARCATRVPGQDCKTYLHTAMTDPAAFVAPGFQPIMPDAQRTLSASQIWALVAFLQSAGGEVTVTGADVAAADEDAAGAGGSGAVAAGAFAGGSTDAAELLQAGTCLTCHQLNGQGGGIGPSFDGMGARLSPERIRHGILLPNADTAAGFAAMAGTMPTTYGQQLTAAQLEVLVQFLAERK